jgi:hypothetical protein
VIRRVAVAVLVAVGLTLAPAVTASAAPADDIYALVNQDRWENGQAGLLRNAAMDRVAADWADRYAPATTVLRSDPMPSIVVTTTCPAAR